MLAVQLLNHPKVVLDGERLVLPQGKSSAFLYYLAYQDTWVSRKDLIFLFWPDSENKQAHSNLRSLLSRSIGKLQGIELETMGDKIWWKVESDVRLLRNVIKNNDLSQSVDLLSKELLKGFYCPKVTEFENWLNQERNELKRLFKEHAFRLSDDLISYERYEEAAIVLKKVLEYDQFDEMCLRKYLKVIYFSEGQSSAQQVLETYQHNLKQVLYGEPEFATLTLLHELEAFENKKLTNADSVAISLKFADKPLHNLPLKLTTFIGRIEEKADLTAQLSNPAKRLITLLGTGGIGKTRLAIALAEDQIGRYAHGIWFISFASLQDSKNMLYEIAEALNFKFYGQDNPKTQLLRYLMDKEILLILDNLEHLSEGTVLISELLETAPKLKVLATSRETLKLHGENIFQVRGLAYGQEYQENMDAQSLFVQSAQQRIRGFEITEDNYTAINQICNKVEGMPLAIELAASWISILTPHEIAQELSQGIDILQGQTKDTPKRHKSIKDIFEYSWNLLSSIEQDILAKLSVFTGGFTRDAAKYVTDATLPILASLVNKSFLRVMSNGRYSNHPLMLQFTQEKLSALSKEKNHTQEKQALYYLTMVEEAESYLEGPEQATWFSRLEQEHDNIRNVLGWALAHDQIELSLRVSGSLGHFWAIHFG